MNDSNIENAWTKLNPQTQEWLRANPGAVILPRSVTESIVQATDRPNSPQGVDRNGQLPLSPQDRAFIKAMAKASPVGRPLPPAEPAG
jgi:hypothetical protein